MKILRVADVPDNRTGGMSRVMYGTGDVMQRLGHVVEYLFTEQIGPGWGKLRRFVVPWRVVRHVARQQRGQTPYDVVEVHEPSAAAYAACRLLGKSLPPLVVFSHGVESRGRQAMLHYRRAKGVPVSLKQKYSPLSVVWQANFALRHADHVVCLNTEDVEFVSTMRGGSNNVSCLPNGMDDSFLAHGATRLWERDLARRLLFFGTWIERKGIAELATAATRVLDEFADGRLTVAGCYHPGSVVRALFPERLQSRIDVIPGITDDHTLAEIYRRYGTLVLPSYFEGQPLVMLEAAAMGLAIVSTNICGMRDFVEPGRDGWLVPPGDADALTAVLRRLMANPEEVRALGEAARAKAQAYTWDNAARATLAAYEQAKRYVSGRKSCEVALDEQRCALER